jgi:hypothetical protein
MDYSHNSAAIASALDLLAALTGNIQSSGGTRSVEFVGALANTNVNQMTVQDSTVAKAVAGGISITRTAGADAVAEVAGQWTIAISATPASGTWTLNGNTMQWYADANTIASVCGATSCSGAMSDGGTLTITFANSQGSVSASSIDLVDGGASPVTLTPTQTVTYVAPVAATSTYWTFGDTVSGGTITGTWTLTVSGTPLSGKSYPIVGSEIEAAFFAQGITGTYSAGVFTKTATGNDTTEATAATNELGALIAVSVVTDQQGASAGGGKNLLLMGVG